MKVMMNKIRTFIPRRNTQKILKEIFGLEKSSFVLVVSRILYIMMSVYLDLNLLTSHLLQHRDVRDKTNKCRIDLIFVSVWKTMTKAGFQ